MANFTVPPQQWFRSPDSQVPFPVGQNTIVERPDIQRVFQKTELWSPVIQRPQNAAG